MISQVTMFVRKVDAIGAFCCVTEPVEVPDNATDKEIIHAWIDKYIDKYESAGAALGIDVSPY